MCAVVWNLCYIKNFVIIRFYNFFRFFLLLFVELHKNYNLSFEIRIKNANVIAIIHYMTKL